MNAMIAPTLTGDSDDPMRPSSDKQQPAGNPERSIYLAGLLSFFRDMDDEAIRLNSAVEDCRVSRECR
jgi:hypothetical protein